MANRITEITVRVSFSLVTINDYTLDKDLQPDLQTAIDNALQKFVRERHRIAASGSAIYMESKQR